MPKKALKILAICTLSTLFLDVYLYTSPYHILPGSNLIVHEFPEARDRLIDPLTRAACDNSNEIAGKTKDFIRSSRGQAHFETIKKNIYKYDFGQGDRESQIKEEWTYLYKDLDGSVGTFFDEDGKVLYQTCGQG